MKSLHCKSYSGFSIFVEKASLLSTVLRNLRYSYENITKKFDYKSSCFENEKQQTRVSPILELVSDAYLTGLQLKAHRARTTYSCFESNYCLACVV